MPPRLLLTHVVFVWSTLTLLRLLLPPPPSLHVPKSYFFQFSPNTILSTKSSQMKKNSSSMSHCITIGLLLSLNLRISTCRESYLCPALEGISHSISQTMCFGHWIGPTSTVEITPAFAQAAIWPVWVPGVEEHSLGFMTLKIREHCWEKGLCAHLCSFRNMTPIPLTFTRCIR